MKFVTNAKRLYNVANLCGVSAFALACEMHGEYPDVFTREWVVAMGGQ